MTIACNMPFPDVIEILHKSVPVVMTAFYLIIVKYMDRQPLAFDAIKSYQMSQIELLLTIDKLR